MDNTHMLVFLFFSSLGCRHALCHIVSLGRFHRERESDATGYVTGRPRAECVCCACAVRGGEGGVALNTQFCVVIDIFS